MNIVGPWSIPELAISDDSLLDACTTALIAHAHVEDANGVVIADYRPQEDDDGE